MASLTNFLVLIFFLANVCYGQLCGPNVKYEPLDIKRAEGVTHNWYDTIDIMPGLTLPRKYDFCNDITNIKEVEDGFILTFTRTVEGQSFTLDTYSHFIYNGNGTYRANDPKYLDAYVETALKSFSHADEDYLKAIPDIVYSFFSGNWFFITDYDEYFIMAKCLPGDELMAFIEHKNKQPTAHDVVKRWSLFSKLGATPEPQFESFCASRKQEIEKN